MMYPWHALAQILADLTHLSAWPVFVGLLVTSSVIVIASDWRFWLWSLLAQYILLGVLHMRVLEPELALTKVVAGVLVCPMLYWAARSVESERAHKAEVERERITREQGQVPLPPLPWPVRSTNWMFRLLTILLLFLVLYSISRSLPGGLPLVDADTALVCTWLWLVGLLVLVLTSEPLPAGVGLLTLVSGFDLFFDAFSPGLVGLGILSAVTLLLGLAISYLTTVRELTGELL